jgi:hypothetical protein
MAAWRQGPGGKAQEAVGSAAKELPPAFRELFNPVGYSTTASITLGSYSQFGSSTVLAAELVV